MERHSSIGRDVLKQLAAVFANNRMAKREPKEFVGARPTIWRDRRCQRAGLLNRRHTGNANAHVGGAQKR